MLNSRKPDTLYVTNFKIEVKPSKTSKKYNRVNGKAMETKATGLYICQPDISSVHVFELQ